MLEIAHCPLVTHHLKPQFLCSVSTTTKILSLSSSNYCYRLTEGLSTSLRIFLSFFVSVILLFAGDSIRKRPTLTHTCRRSPYPDSPSTPPPATEAPTYPGRSRSDTATTAASPRRTRARPCCDPRSRRRRRRSSTLTRPRRVWTCPVF